MARIAGLLYAVAAYLLFVAVLGWTVAFVGNFAVPKSIDTGIAQTAPLAVLIDVGLLVLFALQHSIMARQGFKRWWTQWVPPSLERSTYVLAASLALGLVMWQWQPLPAVLWQIENTLGATLLWMGFWLGWVQVLVSSFLINHFNLFGLQQAWAAFRLRSVPPMAFKTPSLYRVVRHPLYLGFVLGVWMTPHMTVGHLLFAAGSTGYILVGIFFEERDLLRTFGEAYRRYQADVPMLLPWVRRSRHEAGHAAVK